MRRFLILVLLLGVTNPTWAQGKNPSNALVSKIKGLFISADESNRDTEADTMDLRGHVQVIYKDEHLSCDHARVNFRAKTLDAEGGVVLVGPKATVVSERMFLDYESDTGVIYDGSVKAGNVYVEGSMITRQGETDYLAEDAKFTTCTNCPESWSFSGQRIRAELGGYAYIKNSFLRFGGWPLFWLPYLVVPLKSDRQTGLLTPGFEQSDTGGLALSESFFWAMSKSQDLTITEKNYELRGLKSMADYRYVLGPNSSGELQTATLHDRVFAYDERLNQFRGTNEKNQAIDRWYLKYDHYYELPDGFVQRVDLNDASDLQYPKDFPLESQNLGDAAMENRMSVAKNTQNQHFSLDTSYYVNTLQANPLAGNNDAVHRLPELRFSQAMSPVGNSGLLYTLDVDYTNFARSGFGYDQMNHGYNPNSSNANTYDPTSSNPNATRTANNNCPTVDPNNPYWYNNANCHETRDSSYDPSRDIIRTGQRLDSTATLYRPFQIADTLDLVPKLSFRETDYQFNVGDDPSSSRRYVRAELTARSTFSRIYGSTGPGSFERLKHEIVPEVTYTKVPWFQQPYHPFFGTYAAQQQAPFVSEQSISDADIGGPLGVQFDYGDRVYDRDLVTFGVTNRFVQKRWVQGVPEYREVLYWKLAQSYDLYEAQNDPLHEPYSDVSSDFRVTLDHFLIQSQANYYPYQQVTNSNSRFRSMDDDGDFAEIAYHLAYNISPGQDNPDAQSRTEDYAFSLGTRLKYIEAMGRVTYDINPPTQDQKIKSFGYGAQFRLPGDCVYFTLEQYRLTNSDNNIQVSFQFVWDGQTKPHLPEDLLDRLSF